MQNPLNNALLTGTVGIAAGVFDVLVSGVSKLRQQATSTTCLFFFDTTTEFLKYDSASSGTVSLSGAVVRAATGNLDVTTAGKGLRVKEGSNAKQGTSALVGGTVVVSNTSVTANSRIFPAVQSLGTVAAPKAIGVTARTAGTSFTITSADATDTSVVAWEIFEPAA